MPRNYTKNHVSQRKLKLILNAPDCNTAAKLTGVTHSWCWVLRRREGIHKMTKARYSQEDTAKLVSLFHDQIPYKYIAKILKRSESSVCNKIRNLKIKGIL